MPTTPLRERQDPPLFPPTFLDDQREPDTPSAKEVFTAPRNAGKPLAAAARPAKVYSQVHCPVCGDRIGDRNGGDFIGHAPCCHRGPCIKPDCIKAYYGSRKMWATPYQGKKPLYCQAAGCGRRIGSWWYVRAEILAVSRTAVTNTAQRNREADAAYYRAMAKRDEEAKKEQGREEKKQQKRLYKDRMLRVGELSGSKCLDVCFFGFVFCCPCVICSVW